MADTYRSRIDRGYYKTVYLSDTPNKYQQYRFAGKQKTERLPIWMTILLGVFSFLPMAVAILYVMMDGPLVLVVVFYISTCFALANWSGFFLYERYARSFNRKIYTANIGYNVNEYPMYLLSDDVLSLAEEVLDVSEYDQCDTVYREMLTKTIDAYLREVTTTKRNDTIDRAQRIADKTSLNLQTILRQRRTAINSRVYERTSQSTLAEITQHLNNNAT